MLCKICNKNETDNTSGICWECINKSSISFDFSGYIFLRKKNFKRISSTGNLFKTQKVVSHCTNPKWKGNKIKYVLVS
jgi:predicted amidophosphoribosyltransferase